MLCRRLLTASFFGCLALFLACVGDDPDDRTQTSGIDAGGDVAQNGGDAASADASDAAPRTCDVSAPFTSIELVSELNATGLHNFGARLTTDRRTVYFHRQLSTQPIRIYAATRPTVDAPFEAVTPVELATPDAGVDSFPSLSHDGSVLYFQRRTGPSLSDDATIWFALRQGGTFQAPQQEPILDVPGPFERMPYAGADGTVWLVLDEANDAGVRHGRVARAAKGGAPVALDLGATESDEAPVISADGLTLYFFSRRTTMGVWVAKRASTSAPFDPPTPVAELNTVGVTFPSSLSGDGCELFVYRIIAVGDGGVDNGEGTADGNWRIYRARR